MRRDALRSVYRIQANTRRSRTAADIRRDALRAVHRIQANTSSVAERQICKETPCELFTESKQIRNEVAELQVDIADIAACTKYRVYSVHKDDQMEAVMKNKDRLATIVIGRT